MIFVVVPTYGRSGRMEPLARNILENSQTPVKVFFVVEEDDAQSVAEAERLNKDLVSFVLNARKKTYAGAVNTAARYLLPQGFDYLFLGADDLDFRTGWDVEALETAKETGAQVIGTNDLHNPYVLAGTHATHYLIDCRYLTREPYDPDMVGQVLYEGYDHNYTDTEFIGAAKAASIFAPCMTAVVEHRHPDWGMSPADATFAKTRAHLREDEALFNSRRHLWEH